MSNGVKCALAIGGTILYVLCPLDGDFIPVIGWLDDIGVVGLCVKYVTGLMTQKQAAVQELRGKKPTAIAVIEPKERILPSSIFLEDDEVIDAEFEVRS